MATVPNVTRQQAMICVSETKRGRHSSSSSLAQDEQPGISPTAPGHLAKRINFIERFRALLASKDLTVNLLSKKTEQLFGSQSSYFIPHNFCYNVVAYGLTPHVCQVFALSKITGYNLTDLFTFFGFPPDIISRQQSKLHTQRTILLPSASYDQDALLPYFGSKVMPELMNSTGPLSRILSKSPLSPVHKIEACNRKSYLYARIGTEDALAFPDLVPGSIVRVDPLRCSVEEESARKDAKPPIYLVEHSLGLTCCHVTSLGRDRILLTPPSLVFEHTELHLGNEAVILGRVDAEIRPAHGYSPMSNLSATKPTRRKGPRKTLGADPSVSELLRYSRERIGMNFRRANELSQQIAREFANGDYAISLGLLCDLEASNTVPRHIAKVFSFCILYCLDLWSYLRAAKVPLEEAGRERLPKYYFAEADANALAEEISAVTGEPNFTQYLTNALGEIPAFLHTGISHLLPGYALTDHDLYWIGRKEKALHPLLEGAFVIAVDGMARGTKIQGTESRWERPLYLLLLRDGRYLCGFCTITNDFITLIPHPDCNVAPMRFSNDKDAEVIGQVKAIARVL